MPGNGTGGGRFFRPAGLFPTLAGDIVPDGGRLVAATGFEPLFSPDGTVWLAADDGLRQFDGFTWNLLPGTNNGLPGNFTRAVYADQQGRLWVGSDAGTGIWDARQHTLTRTVRRPAWPTPMSGKLTGPPMAPSGSAVINGPLPPTGRAD